MPASTVAADDALPAIDQEPVQLDPGGFAPADPPRLRSRGPVAPLRSGGRACGAPSPLCGSLRKRVTSTEFSFRAAYGLTSAGYAGGRSSEIRVASKAARMDGICVGMAGFNTFVRTPCKARVVRCLCLWRSFAHEYHRRRGGGRLQRSSWHSRADG